MNYGLDFASGYIILSLVGVAHFACTTLFAKDRRLTTGSNMARALAAPVLFSRLHRRHVVAVANEAFFA